MGSALKCTTITLNNIRGKNGNWKVMKGVGP
jgi:hypothetical protein